MGKGTDGNFKDVVIQIKRKTSAAWTFNNPILAEGEIGYELDLRGVKIGDGVTTWVYLPYFSGSASVTSVDATISGALGVSGGPITSSGTLAFTWQGNSNEYVLGDGSLATKITNNNQLANGAGYITSSSLSGYVPYVGATTDLDLGSNDFTTTGLSTLGETRIVHGTIANQGIVIRSQVGTTANGAIYMSVIPSATNHSLVYDATNNQTRINGTAGVVLSHNNNSRMIVNSANMSFVLGSGAADLNAYNFSIPTSNNSLSNEYSGFRIVGTSSKNFPVGTLALQREVLITSTTYTFTLPSNLTMAASLGVEYVLGGTNANIVAGAAIYVGTKLVTNTVTSYGILIEASTGATNNIAARFIGDTEITGTESTGITQQTSNYTFAGIGTVEATSGTWNLTLPTAVGISGKWYRFANNGAGIVTLLTTGGQTVNGFASGVITFNPGDNASFQSNGTNWVMFD